MFLRFVGQEIIHNPTTEGILRETVTSPQFLMSDQGFFFITVYQIEKETKSRTPDCRFPNFPFLNTKIPSTPTPLEFVWVLCTPLIPSTKIHFGKEVNLSEPSKHLSTKYLRAKNMD